MTPSIPVALRACALQAANILGSQRPYGALGLQHGCVASSRVNRPQIAAVWRKNVHGALPVQAVVDGTHDKPIFINFDSIWHANARSSPGSDGATGLRRRHPHAHGWVAGTGTALQSGKAAEGEAPKRYPSLPPSTIRRRCLGYRFGGRQNLPARRVVSIIPFKSSGIGNVDRQQAPLGRATAPDRGRVLLSVYGQGNPVKRFGSLLEAQKRHPTDEGPESAPPIRGGQPRNYEFDGTSEVIP